MKILVINGPNLNLLGKRDPVKYGNLTLAKINKQLTLMAKHFHCLLTFFQSNCEGEIIDFLQKETDNACGVLINPGALTHYGYSLRDALADTKLPIVEIHLSDINNREKFRRIDVFDGIVVKKIVGLQQKSYFSGLEILVSHLRDRSK